MSNLLYEFDPTEVFPNLPYAPIEEAVIQWHMRPGTLAESAEKFESLKAILNDYPVSKVIHGIGISAAFSSTEGDHIHQKREWFAYRFESSDGRCIAQFTKTGFIFSRLKPYKDWESFESEALRLLQVYLNFALNTEIKSLSARYINLIVMESINDLPRWLKHPPISPPPMELPIGEFAHQSNYSVPNLPLSLRIVLATQPSQDSGMNLIVDLDVSTTGAVDSDDTGTRLRELRSLKNKAFTSLLTKEAIQHYQGDS